ncbi:MAG: hypothetical protein IKZ38_04885 [Clostridia bacterium]|nr:hypothetical protein [Clostridia bacterium]
MENKPGSVTSVLELISKFNLNISYISLQENGSGYQYFKMGLYVNERSDINEFLAQAEKLCEVNVSRLIKGVYKSNHAVKMKQKKTNENFR